MTFFILQVLSTTLPGNISLPQVFCKGAVHPLWFEPPA